MLLLWGYAVVYAANIANNNQWNSKFLTSSISLPWKRTLKELPKHAKANPCNLKLYCSYQMPLFVSDADKDKGLFMVSCYIWEECEDVNFLILKDYKKGKQSMCKECKKKSYFLSLYLYYFWWQKVHHVMIYTINKIVNIRKLSQWCVQRGRCS